MIKKIKKYGTSLVVTFPKRELELYQIELGDIVQVELTLVRKDDKKDVQKETI